MDSKFSYDMFMEIASRTSLRTLEAMRCTSKDLEKLTYDPYLLSLHMQRNSIISGFLVPKTWNACEYITDFAPAPESNSLDLRFLPDNASILASSEQGLIVFVSPYPRTCRTVCYHVCKPATKQILELPNPKTKYLTQKVAMVVMGSNPLHYKIVRLSVPKPTILCKYEHRTSYRCEVFDSKAWAWRLLDLIILPYSVFLAYTQQPITTKGSIYVPLTNKQVLKFDAYSEKWTTISPPVENVEVHKLVKYQGKLGFTCVTPKSNRSWEIWVLTGKDDSWEKLDVFLGEKKVEAICDPETRVAWDKNKMRLVFSKLKGGDHVSEINMFNGGHYPSEILFPFRSNFELVDLRGL